MAFFILFALLILFFCTRIPNKVSRGLVGATSIFMILFSAHENIKELLEKAENPIKSRQQSFSIFMENDDRPKSLSGVWQGQYIDVRGYKGNLELQLEHTGDRVEGTFRLIIKEEDRSQVFTGKITGITKPESDLLQARVIPYNKQKEAEPIPLEFNLSNAGSYAEYALFASVAQNIHPDLGGGVWIAWKFNKDSLH